MAPGRRNRPRRTPTWYITVTMHRRAFLLAAGAQLAKAASRLPVNENVKWAVSANLWNSFPHGPITDVLDVMRDTGFIGIRLTQFPGILKTYDISTATLEKELTRRNLHVATISFNGPAQDAEQHAKYLASAKEAMQFLQTLGANHLVVFSPARPALTPPGGKAIPVHEAQFKTMCAGFNKLGELARSMNFHAGLHNHMDQMVETSEEVDRCMALTDPALFGFSPDTAHLYLGGSDVPALMAKHKSRLRFLDYKDARWTEPAADFLQATGKTIPKNSRSARFLNSIYDLGDGAIDFSACHKVLKSIAYKGWICVDLDTARNGPRASYERCGHYIVEKLEPIYV